jgi:predicted dithiol-disulfide oxidoreductase (DUF899 family)
MLLERQPSSMRRFLQSCHLAYSQLRREDEMTLMDPDGAPQLMNFDAALEAKEDHIFRLQKELVDFRRQRPIEQVRNYSFVDLDDREVKLLDLFGDKRELILVHNMGIACSHCTLWADGFNGVLEHLESRAGFVVISPDPPKVQRVLAKSRGWKFKMASAQGTTFIADLGFADDVGQPTPGISTLKRESAGSIARYQRTRFFPQDNYCIVWHMLELLPAGLHQWEPVKPVLADLVTGAAR